MTLSAADAAAFERCIAGGGVALFGADTVYGLAVDPESEAAVARLYELKRRPADVPAAVMFFALEPALAALGDLGPRTRAAVGALLPGAVTLLLPNPDGRWPLACGPDRATLGLRVPVLAPSTAALAVVERPVLQSSANVHGAPEAARLEDVDATVRAGVELELDAGELPGTPSTVVDLRSYGAGGTYAVLREGALTAAEVAEFLKSS